MNRYFSLIALLLVLLIANTFAQTFYKSGNCPLENTVTNCGTRCVSDSQCSLNQKCCPNKCGHRSCTEPSAVSTGTGYKSQSAKQDVYCNGVKCSPYEKCQYDRNSRREKCMRA